MTQVSVGDMIAIGYLPNIRCSYRVARIYDSDRYADLLVERITGANEQDRVAIRDTRVISMYDLKNRLSAGLWKRFSPLEQLANAAE